ncbi:hypothetical protein FRB93_003920 [Tulasnella sp. JGI-2019a]|nr:hypothetical protein FRB93_003920 [Tulasnella sp. JGI-2019a]
MPDGLDATPEHDVFSQYGRLIIEEGIRKDEARRAPHDQLFSLQETKLQEPSKDRTEFVPLPAPKPGQLQVGILGAGAGGLYTAMILQRLSIPFEILEAQDRTGGRLYTHHFIAKDKDGKPLPHQPKHDYYDVGAMRFPKTNIMKRLFHLFDHLDLTTENKKLIDYYFVCDEAFKMHNGIRKYVKDVKAHSTDPDKVDPFGFAIDHGGDVNDDFIYPGYSSLYNDAIKPFTTALTNDTKPNAKPAGAGWRKLMRFDQFSTRSYMSQCLKYDMNAINWMETMSYSTGWYDQSLAETVLEDMVLS